MNISIELQNCLLCLSSLQRQNLFDFNVWGKNLSDLFAHKQGGQEVKHFRSDERQEGRMKKYIISFFSRCAKVQEKITGSDEVVNELGKILNI